MSDIPPVKTPRKRKASTAEFRKMIERVYVEGEQPLTVLREAGYAELSAKNGFSAIKHTKGFIKAKNEFQKAILDKNPCIFDKAAIQMDEGLESVTTGKYAGEPDRYARAKYLELLSRLFGFVEPDKIQVNQVNILDSEKMKEVMEIAEKIFERKNAIT